MQVPLSMHYREEFYISNAITHSLNHDNSNGVDAFKIFDDAKLAAEVSVPGCRYEGHVTGTSIAL